MTATLGNEFPPGWDKARDVVIVVDGTTALRDALCATGHERVLLYEPVAEAPPLSSDRVHSLQQLSLAFRRFSGWVSAQQVCLVGGHHPLKTDALMQAVLQVAQNAIERLRLQQRSSDAFGERWVLHTLSNLGNIARWPGIEALTPQLRGLPCVIVAAGPSLTKNVTQLRQLRGRAVVIAVSHALRALAAAEVDADLCLVTDADDLMYHFDGYDLPRLGALIAASCVEPRVFQLPLRRFFAFPSNVHAEGWAYAGMGPWTAVTNGGSVATTAMGMAKLWQCNPIILVGQDLAFGEHGEYYAATLADGGARANLRDDGTFTASGIAGGPDSPVERRVTVPGYYGKDVQTSYSFFAFAQWFSETAKTLAPAIKTYNCTEGGAYIDGMEHVPLGQAIASLPGTAVDVEAALCAVWDGFDAPLRLCAMRQRALTMSQELQRCLRAAKRCRTLAGQAAGNQKRMAKLSHAEQELQRGLQGVPFISAMRQREIRDALACGAAATEPDQVTAASLQLYELVAQACVLAWPRLQAVQQHLKSA